MKHWWLSVGIVILTVIGIFVLRDVDTNSTQNLVTSVFSSEEILREYKVCKRRRMEKYGDWDLRKKTCDEFNAVHEKWQEMWDFWIEKSRKVGKKAGLTKISGRNYDGLAQDLQTGIEIVQSINDNDHLKKVNDLICQICLKQNTKIKCPSCP